MLNIWFKNELNYFVIKVIKDYYFITYLAKILRTTHIAMNIAAKPPIIAKSVGSTYDPADISILDEAASEISIKDY